MSQKESLLLALLLTLKKEKAVAQKKLVKRVHLDQVKRNQLQLEALTKTSKNKKARFSSGLFLCPIF